MPVSTIRPAPTRTRLCVDGKAILYEFYLDFSLPHKQCEKVLAA
jgi:hypothetical protein